MARLIYVTLALLLHSTQGLAPDYSTARVIASQAVRDGEPPSTLQEMQTQPNIARLMRVFPSESWAALFPNANEDAGPDGTPYNYFNLVSAAWKFPRFCGEPGQTDEECLHELVVMFAHFIQETGGKRGPEEGVEDGLYWLREIGCYSSSNPHGGSCNGYCSDSGIWGVYPCGNRAYYGRGAKQLSWNYNYAFFSKKMTGSANTYLVEPDRIITDGWPALASAIWFWMTPQMPKPSMHEVVTGLWAPNAADAAAGIIAGFGTTTNIINGAIECGHGSESQQSAWRISYYRSLCTKLGAACFTTSDSCASPMHSQFPVDGTGGSGPLFYLDQRWDGVEGCKPVAYQMPFVANLDEHECKCHFFPDNADCVAEDDTTTNAPAPTTTPAADSSTTVQPTTTPEGSGACVSFTAGAGTGFCHGFLAAAASQLGISVGSIASFDQDPSDVSGGNPPLCTRGDDGTFASSPNTALWGGVLYRVCGSGSDSTSNPISTTSVPATTSTTSSAAPTSSAPDTDCAAEWEQCGGTGVADRCCQEGTQCFMNSEWYSQCRTSCPAGWACNGSRRNLRGAK